MKFWAWLKEFYKRLDGNKTAIGTTLLAVVNVPVVSIALGTWYIPVVLIIGLLTGVSAYQRVIKKNSFSKNYR